MDDSMDVPDSTDWIGTPLASLVPVEQALRCHVCKDFYNSPMLTTCNHTFCSLCIRHSLGTDGKCPLCRAPDQESKLRGNWAMREVVEAFTNSRSDILQFARNPPARQHGGSPKRKASDSLDDAPSKRSRTSTRSTRSRAAETAALVIEDDEDEEENEEEEEEESAYDEDEPDDGLVACPICLGRMKEQQVDKHLDTSCPGSPLPRDQRKSTATHPSDRGIKSTMPGSTSSSYAFAASAAKPLERLPTLSYSMMKDTALRKKLADLGISSAGNKQMMEQRHREWVMLWNANCDSSRPKRRAELLQDLETWERTVGSRASNMSRAAQVGAQIKGKDFDGAAWSAQHDDSFKDLIARAKASKRQAEQKAKDAADEAAQEVTQETSQETAQDATQETAQEAGAAPELNTEPHISKAVSDSVEPSAPPTAGLPSVQEATQLGHPYYGSISAAEALPASLQQPRQAERGFDHPFALTPLAPSQGQLRGTYYHAPAQGPRADVWWPPGPPPWGSN